ncbi:MAG TPA: tetratricopeptide repeat protein [Candidatus Methylomirabilis sp.]|nr:tetratricopeptide repeat protein [Candidatus Methylomirabilis sp.]
MKRASKAASGIFVLLALASGGLGARQASRAAGKERLAAARAPAQVTFDRNVAPIIFRSCAQCHHPGEAGPFPLLSYADVKSHARQIALVTRNRIMPPWLPEPNDPKFAEEDELRLSNEEIATLQAWVDQGELEGSPADRPQPPAFTAGWQLGKPDVIVRAEKPYQLRASGTDMYWNFVFRTPVHRSRWLKAIEIRPGDKRLVHHANVLVDREQSGRRLEKEPGAGFGGMELIVESETFDPDSHFLFWKPGSPPYVEPDGMALRLDKDTDLILNTHLQPSGKLELIQPTLGLYFTDKPATMHPILLQLDNDRMLDIPPGERNFLVSDDFTLPVDADVLAIYPHAHYLGKDLLAFARLPDGTRKTLIHIKHWDLNWQAVYRYAQPLALPKGTTISMRFTYDNSAENIRNPNQPPKRVVAGNRASDEMAHLWLQILPSDTSGSTADPRIAIQEALAQHHIQNNPEDFEAHYNLGAILQMKGDVPGAIGQFTEAVGIHPDDPTANNALGAVLLAGGHVDDAVPHLKTALQARPDYFDAHYNLGNALATNGDFPGALEQFRAAVKINPQDANAEANLGSALAETGNLRDARTHFQRALQIDPKNELARENLEQLDRDAKGRPN